MDTLLLFASLLFIFSYISCSFYNISFHFTAGLILYHYQQNDSSSPNDITPILQSKINTFLSLHLQKPTQKRIPIPTTASTSKSTSTTSLSDLPQGQEQQQQQQHANTISEWIANDDLMIVVLYSRVVLEQNAGGLGMNWIQSSLLQDLMKEFTLFKTYAFKKENEENDDDDIDSVLIEKCHLFNKTFEALYKKCEMKGRLDKLNNYASVTTSIEKQSSTATTSKSNESIKVKKKKGKEDRVWYDSEQKVTTAAMAKLDRSKEKDRVGENDDPMFLSESSPALIEARAAYLPNQDEVPSWEQEDQLMDDDYDDSVENSDSKGSGWGSSLKGMMDQFSGKVLTDEDLDAPLEDMEKMLTGKNVAREIAKDICFTVRNKLVGKKMASFTRVKTAVRQALEIAVEKILRPGKGRGGGEEIDLLRNVVSKRESGMIGSLFGKSSTERKRPYVIVMGKYHSCNRTTRVFFL